MPGPAVRRPAGLCAVLVIAAGVCVVLGRWQLDRAEQSRAAAAEFRSAADLEPLTGPGGTAEAMPRRFRGIRLEGRYEPGTQVLLDNITRDGAAGYYVLTPFAPASGERRVLVNRGWIAADPDRGVVPRLDVETRPRTLSGRVDRLPSAALSLDASAEAVRDGIYRVSFPTIAELERLLDVELAPFQVLLDPAEADGFGRRWMPETRRADRNTAYAGQWFMMAAAAFGVAAWAALRAFQAIRRR